jgi:mRNA-degrading endonuclease toxin of MazEF toxin-antitoxin module
VRRHRPRAACGPRGVRAAGRPVSGAAVRRWCGGPRGPPPARARPSLRSPRGSGGRWGATRLGPGEARSSAPREATADALTARGERGPGALSAGSRTAAPDVSPTSGRVGRPEGARPRLRCQRSHSTSSDGSTSTAPMSDSRIAYATTCPSWRNGVSVEVIRMPKPAAVVSADPASAPPVFVIVARIASLRSRVAVAVLLEATRHVDRVGHADADRETGERRRDRTERDAGQVHEAEGPQHDERHGDHRHHAEERTPVLDAERQHQHERRDDDGDEQRGHLRVDERVGDRAGDHVLRRDDDVEPARPDRREVVEQVVAQRSARRTRRPGCRSRAALRSGGRRSARARSRAPRSDDARRVEQRERRPRPPRCGRSRGRSPAASTACAATGSAGSPSGPGTNRPCTTETGERTCARGPTGVSTTITSGCRPSRRWRRPAR